jgi:putative oxygen-independent coproporphyrinogen III oxidase
MGARVDALACLNVRTQRPVMLPPLTLYVHIPWCVRKCPYCDFNSHALRGEIPEAQFIDALLQDLAWDYRPADGRQIISIFIGGGTPSLLSGTGITRLLAGIRSHCACAPDLEVTLEANPGTAEAWRFAAYREVGVTRLSVGVQSFTDAQLSALGRIHNAKEARAAIHLARSAGFDQVNMDLMFGLPGQTLTDALRDLTTALDLEPDHLSYYQLTLEPNTAFHHTPPALPDEDLMWEMQEQGQQRLAARGFAQYEVSAYAQMGKRCRHNLNYWQFGDYLGIGPGAHGKLTDADGRVVRHWKPRQPEDYLARRCSGPFHAGQRTLTPDDLKTEFLMNALRLREGFSLQLFETRTGLDRCVLAAGLKRAQQAGLLDLNDEHVCTTAMGYSFLNQLLLLL